MTTVVLGNRNALESKDNGETRVAMRRAKRATVIEFPEDQPLGESFQTVTTGQGVWAAHAEEGAVPAWVASDSPALAALLAEHFGGTEVRELADPFDPATAKGKQKVIQAAGRRKAGGGHSGSEKAAKLLGPMLGLFLTVTVFLGVLHQLMLALKTNAGNDFQAAQMAGSASATAVAKWVALTANVTAPAAGDTTLTAEIATASGGLIRKIGTYAHTTGAANYTITTVFTVNGNDVIPVTIGKRGIFDAASAGNMVFETLVSPTATLSAVGDSLTLTDTISL